MNGLYLSEEEDERNLESLEAEIDVQEEIVEEEERNVELNQYWMDLDRVTYSYFINLV